MKSTTTADRLRELLNYTPETGVFTWKIRHGRMTAGSVAGTVKKTDGFRYIQMDGRERLAHHLAWLYVTGEWPDAEIVQTNGDRSDIRIENLCKVDNSGDWRDIPGFKGYQASLDGRIRSLRGRTPVVMKPEIDKDGYRRVQLYADGRRARHIGVHRAVALAFHGDVPAGSGVACHNDGDPANNSASNVRWDTQVNNIADKRAHGTHQIGSKHPRAVCNEMLAVEARRLLNAGMTLKRAAEALGLSRHIVADISRGRTWKNV